MTQALPRTHAGRLSRTLVTSLFWLGLLGLSFAFFLGLAVMSSLAIPAGS